MQSGARLGPYQIVEPLGAGGMGEVYLATDTRLGRKVAIKVLPGEFARDRERLARFEQEARAAAALNHPGIAAVYDVGVEGEGDGRTHYIVQEFLEGETLADLMAGAPIPRNRALKLGAEIASALAVAHQAGIIHRDLKPANVFVIPEGRAKVLDFGLAKLTEMSAVRTSGDSSMSPTVVGTMAGTIMGTAGYMAPEQVHGQGVDQRADLFALGCVLYELLGGRRAFGGKSLPDTLAKILHAEPEPLAGVGPALERTLDKCLAKDPAERYQHADDLAVDLRYLATQGSPAAAVTEAEASRPTGVSVMAAAGMTLAALVLGALGSSWLGGSAAGSGGNVAAAIPEQLTRFATSAWMPAISHNGQMVAFTARDPLDGWSQVFVKTLPDGPPLRLTATADHKGYPTFAPDDSRIAYTVIGEDWDWDTWSVPITGGEPRLMLRNANSLQWAPDGRIVFSQFKTGAHLGIVMADESGGNQREIWFPPQSHQMAHESDISPDGTRIVIGYMGASVAGGRQCFVSGLDAVADGEPEPLDVGPDGARCLQRARWSRDGRWLYYESADGPEIWRMPAAGGSAERIVPRSPGIDGIDGFALTPNGESLIYAAGTSPRNVWLRTADGVERQLTFAQDADDPRFSADGASVIYRQAGRRRAGPLWRYRLADGGREPVCPGIAVRGFVTARDDERILVLTEQAEGDGGELWLCHESGSEPPRLLLAEVPLFAGPPVLSHDGEVFYYAVQSESGRSTLWARDTAGGEPRSIREPEQFVFLMGLSPDGRWLSASGLGTASSIAGVGDTRETWLYPVDGGEPRFAVRGWDLEWSPDGSSFLFLNDGMVSSAWELLNADGHLLPSGLPERPDAAWLREAGAVRLMSELGFSRASASPRPYEIVFARTENRSNLYSVRLPE